MLIKNHAHGTCLKKMVISMRKFASLGEEIPAVSFRRDRKFTTGIDLTRNILSLQVRSRRELSAKLRQKLADRFASYRRSLLKR